MNLQENIFRIKTLMTEDKKGDNVRKIIDVIGISDAIEYMGGYNTIEPYLTEIDKVNYVKEKVSQICEEFNSDGFTVSEIYEPHIFYDENDNELRQIEYLGKDYVYVDVYDKYSDAHINQHIGDVKVVYEDLPPHILDEIFEMLLRV